jgi:hypothetical protein
MEATIRTQGWLWVSVAALMVLGACRRSVPAPGDVPPLRRLNVVLVTIDTLRPGRLGCYGNSTIPTPNLDRLAQRGVLFENAVCQAPLLKAALGKKKAKTVTLSRFSPKTDTIGEPGGIKRVAKEFEVFLTREWVVRSPGALETGEALEGRQWTEQRI